MAITSSFKRKGGIKFELRRTDYENNLFLLYMLKVKAATFVCTSVVTEREQTVVNDDGGATTLMPSNEILRQKWVRWLRGIGKPIERWTLLV